MYKYHLSFEAEEDIVRIFEYGLGRFGLQQANKYYDMLFECFNKIASNPFMFPMVTKYKDIDRCCVCGVDTIYYNIKGNKIEIITIIGRQDF
ncbi:type II toxin-antitoxin system RelE/ParE family toxin [Flavobacterium restrictum]|uniref:Type II toxin-antitoxin system RelE/ParE family toxin n=1 Tax=Flavobacterium restrictum TaxID=2594428 RepID=A0A553E2J2_9FLAO|nr:type II toxin-antitoxin system RelE/ParE family toxin [Flavobacterium restrictum]TRX39248.1 type II toxin-antitoxin system RelE/ParE family toxin [Flavobacterium restrictum]